MTYQELRCYRQVWWLKYIQKLKRRDRQNATLTYSIAQFQANDVLNQL